MKPHVAAMTDGLLGESRNLEWKSSWRDEYLKWICGFANAHGGVLVIGKNDRGEIVGVRDPLRLLEEIPNKVLSLLGIVVDVGIKSEADGDSIEIRVDPCPNPISYRGEYHYRSGSTKQVLRGAALNQFLLRKHGRNWDDAPMPGVGLADLDSRALDEFRRRGVSSGRLLPDAVDGSNGDLMEMLRLREGQYLRRAAVLLFHPDPARFFAGAFLTSSPPRGARIPSLRRDMVAPPDSGGLTVHGLPPPKWSYAWLHVRFASPLAQRRGCF